MDPRLREALERLEAVFKASHTAGVDKAIIKSGIESIEGLARHFDRVFGFDELDEIEREELGL